MAKLSRAKIAEIAGLCDLLSDENRVRVVEILSQSREPISVRIVSEMVNMTPSATSHLLGELYFAGVVENKKEGREKLYSLSRSLQAKKALKILAYLS